ncbi:BOS complex subunit NOMO1 [Musca autumnalis]|uniref:BOS complex subunit NOMO1 n=1 Tax=Musca autumnalis TaxID=221902 RepID=UPI003CE76A4B
MRVVRSIFVVLLIKIFILVDFVQPNEVIGCGGFIKSQKDIDFSKVEIKLLTKTGALKDKTDCSPSNGYYFLPIYDKGEYLLKISPPPGWSFEPEEVKLNFDGQTDVCSLGKDVNFVFKGFGITGKVALGSSGAKDVKVELKSEDGKDTRHTITDAKGIFSFTPIIPGKYVVKASHPKWYFEKSEHTVIVEGGNTVLAENSLVVSGFDVTGRFDTFGQLGAGVGIALFKSKQATAAPRCGKEGMPTTTVTNTNAEYDPLVSCYAQVDTAGNYIFKDVRPGKYILLPVVNQNLKLNIKPQFIEIEVTKDTLELKQEFKISGFSVTGVVLNSVGGTPVSGATIKLNGQKVTTTKSDGHFTLENVASSGLYSIQVEAEKLQFDEQRIQLQLTSATLPPIVPSAYEVCGKVVSKKSFRVAITKQESTATPKTVDTNAETGAWCTFLPNGKFTFEVKTSEADRSNGVQFFPVQQTIEVKSEPIKDITFSQLRATLQGALKCLTDAPAEGCLSTEVTLHSLDANGQPTGQKQTTKAQDGKYSFTNVLPGPYEITVPQSSLCFDSTRVLLNVASAQETAPEFVQHGYEVNIISSHRAILKYSHSSATSADNLKLLSGVNTFCVPKYGSYSIKLEGCHLYDEETLPTTFDTANTNPTIINALSHKVGVRVLSPESTADNLKLAVESDTLGKVVVTPVAEAHKVDGKYAFRYDTHLKPEEVLRITPQSDILLFEPLSKEIIGTNDCVDVAFNFVASKGLILNGKVIPAIKDAKITLSFPNNPELEPQTTTTSVSGDFKFGPISDSIKYELKGEKESYVFSDYNPATSSFSVHKLCEIIVKVKDGSGKGLSGVLISLSGSESYRKNLITADDGSINFHSLSPSQYFLRPMLKEFKFEPNSKMIDLKDGETVEVEMIGKRVAYSLFGAVTSLNGEPFAEVNIEATADETCSHHQEEATTEKNGKYRIRGLNPGCEYTIRLKDAGTPGNNVDRSIPQTRTVKIGTDDVEGVNFLAISPITFVDVTARVMASSNDFYKTLRVVMYRKGAYDSPVYSQRLDTPLNPKSRYNPGIMVFFPRIPLDGKTYIVELRSTLSDKTYTYSIRSEQFVADTPSVYIELDFKPEVKSFESDLNQNSISALVLVALVAIAFFKQDIAMGFVNFVWSKINGIAQDLAQKQKSNAKNNQRKVEPINQKEIEQMAEQINNIKKKKTKKI